MSDVRERLRSCVTLGDVEWAVKHIDAKDARIAELEGSIAASLERAREWHKAASERAEFTKNRIDQQGDRMGEAEYAANLEVEISCLDRMRVIEALFPGIRDAALAKAEGRS